jgi:hypothetical protein
MTQLKTDRLEQAKREIREEWKKHSWASNWTDEALIAERARNLELREQIELLQTKLLEKII